MVNGGLGYAETEIGKWRARLSPQSHQSRAESPEFAGHRPGGASLTRGNVGNPLRVSPETELLKPISDLLHSGGARDYRASSARIGRLPDNPAAQ
jgi:hypothetical protein